MSVKKSSKKSKKSRSARFGAAAFAVSLYLAGPQVAVAVADGPDDTSSTPSSNASEAGSATNTAGAVRKPGGATRRGSAESGAPTGRQAQLQLRGGAAALSDPAVPEDVEVAETGRRGPRSAATRTLPAAALSAQQDQQRRSAATISVPAATISVPAGTTSVSAATVSVPAATYGAPAGTISVPVAGVSVPTAVPAPVPTAAVQQPLNPLIAEMYAAQQVTLTSVFRGWLNRLADLPVTPLTQALESAVWLVRRQLVNQNPGINYNQTTNSLGLVQGRIDGIDPEGDAYDIEVYRQPTSGTLTLAKTYEDKGIGTTQYIFVPNSTYTGSAEAVIKVTTDPRGNIFAPFGKLRTQYITVGLGDAAHSVRTGSASELANAGNMTYFMNNVELADLTVTRKWWQNSHSVAFTLPVQTAGRTFAGMDSRGNQFAATASEVLSGTAWKDLVAKAKASGSDGPTVVLLAGPSKAGARDELTIALTAKDVTVNADGSVTVNAVVGEMGADTPGRVDRWDMFGSEYKPGFKAFLSDPAAAIAVIPNRSLAVVVTDFTTVTYKEAGGIDDSLMDQQPLPGSPSASTAASQISPGQPGPGSITKNSASSQPNGQSYSGTGLVSTSLGNALTVLTPYGTDGSFLAGYNASSTAPTNSPPYVVDLYTAAAPGSAVPSWTAPSGDGEGSKNAATPTSANSIWPQNCSTTDCTALGTYNPITAMTAFTPMTIDKTKLPSPAVFSAAGGTLVPIAFTIQTSTLVGTGNINAGLVPPTTKGQVLYLVLPESIGTAPLADALVYATDSSGPAGDPATVVSETKVTAAGTIFNGPQTPSVPGCPDTSSTCTQYALSAKNLVSSATPASPPGTYDGNLAFALQTSAGTTSTPATLTLDQTTCAGGSTNCFTGGISDGNGNPGTQLQIVVPEDWILSTGECPMCAALAPLTVPVDGSVGPPVTLLGATFSSNSATLSTPIINATITGFLGVGPGPMGNNGNVATYSTGLTTGVLAGAVEGPYLKVALPNGLDPATLVNQIIEWSAGADPARITKLVSGSVGGAALYELNTDVAFATTNVTTPNLPARQSGAVVGTADGQVWFWNGASTGCANDKTACDSSSPQAKGWTQLASSLDTTAINTITTLPLPGVSSTSYSLGWPTIAVGTEAGNVYIFEAALDGSTSSTAGTLDGSTSSTAGTLLPLTTTAQEAGCSSINTTACWLNTDVPTGYGAVTAMIASPGGVRIGTATGMVLTYNGTATPQTMTLGNQSQSTSGCNLSNASSCTYSIETGWSTTLEADATLPVTALLPYDGSTFVGSIGGGITTATAPSDLITTTSTSKTWTPDPNTADAELAARYGGCGSSDNATTGAGPGCNGFLLTVQTAYGNPLLAGQTLYGGAGVSPGTTIVKQLSASYETGAPCSGSGCTGGEGIYLVDKYQWIAPGTPMSASAGYGFIAGWQNGQVGGAGANYLYSADGGDPTTTPVGYLADGGWTDYPTSTNKTYFGGVTTMVPWRDGFAVGLGNPGNDGGPGYAAGAGYGGVAAWIPGATCETAPCTRSTAISINNLPEGSGVLPGELNAPTLSYNGRLNSGWTMLSASDGGGGPSAVNSLGTGSAGKDASWGVNITTMTPFGDGIAVGTAAYTSTKDGPLIATLTGFPNLMAPVFGTDDQTTYNGKTTLVYPNTTSEIVAGSFLWNQIANPNQNISNNYDLAQDTTGGTAQQMFSFISDITAPDGSTTSPTGGGETLKNETLVVGLTNGALWAYSPAGTADAGTGWTLIQPPAAQPATPPTDPAKLTSATATANQPYNLYDAWAWATNIADNGGGFTWATGGAYNGTSTNTTAGGGVTCANTTACFGASGELTVPGTNSTLKVDPLFSYLGLQADPNKGAAGTYVPFLYYKEVALPSLPTSMPTIANPNIQVEPVANVLTYGYLFYPHGIINKFIPGKYSVAALTALEVGPVVNAAWANGGLPFDSCTTTGVTTNCGIKKKYDYSKTEETDFGSFNMGVGIEAGVKFLSTSLSTSDGGACTSGVGCAFTTDNGKPSTTPGKPDGTPLASYLYLTGALLTWNVPNADGLNFSVAGFGTLGLLGGDAAITIEPYLEPYVELKYGLFTPPNTPLIGQWSIIEMGAEYQNPATLQVKLSASAGTGAASAKAEVQGVLDLFAKFIPQVTSKLSWDKTMQLYDYKTEFETQF